MSAIPITYSAILTLAVFLAPMFLLNNRLELSINTRTLWVIFRMILQLSAVGFVLQALFTYDHPVVNILYILLMITIAAVSAMNATGLPVKKVGLPLWIAFVVPNFIVLFFFNAFVVRLDTLFAASYMVPIGGMLLGNTLSGNIVGLSRFYEGIRQNEKRHFYLLGLGATRKEAIWPHVRAGVAAAVNPTLASIETIGLVALPGMMTGQILGGSIPVTAIKYQIAIMIAILIIRYFSTLLAIIMTSTRAFNEYDILNI